MKITAKRANKCRPYIPRSLNAVENLAELRRFIIKQGITEHIARSFIRLLSDSDYNETTNTFTYHSCGKTPTESRLKDSSEIGVIWKRETSYSAYRHKYNWTLTGKLHKDLLEKATKIKNKIR
jgi:hypothetical protein